MRRAMAIAALALLPALAARADQDQEDRGAYLARAGGCISCHSAEGGAPLAGGRPLDTPFGTYYSPNITPDPETGIGGWSDGDFLRALRQGVRPDGSHLFPVFPYTTYTRMRRDDALAIKAWLFAQPPARQANRDHDVPPPFGWRWMMGPWKTLFFSAGEWRPPAEPRDETWQRGAYLVEALAHCAECHTPRNLLGALDEDMWMAGTADGPEGELAPNITPHPTGIADWSTGDIVSLLKTGMKPDFDNVQGTMAEAVEDGLGHLSDADLEAIAAYIKALPPIENRVVRPSAR